MKWNDIHSSDHIKMQIELNGEMDSLSPCTWTKLDWHPRLAWLAPPGTWPEPYWSSYELPTPWLESAPSHPILTAHSQTVALTSTYHGRHRPREFPTPSNSPSTLSRSSSPCRALAVHPSRAPPHRDEASCPVVDADSLVGVVGPDPHIELQGDGASVGEDEVVGRALL